MLAKPDRKCDLTPFSIAAIIVFLIPSVLKADVIFIVNTSVQQDTLSRSEIKNIYLGHCLAWPGGDPISLTILDKADIQQEFTKNYTKKTESQFLFYWRRLLFTGKGIYPKPFLTNEDVIKYVAKTKGAIGYISSQSAANKKNVKIIHVTGEQVLFLKSPVTSSNYE